VPYLGEPGVNNPDVVVVICSALGKFSNLSFEQISFALELFHLTKDSAFLEVL